MWHLIKDFFYCSYVPYGLSMLACASECMGDKSSETFNYMANSIILNVIKLFLDRVESNICYQSLGCCSQQLGCQLVVNGCCGE